MTLETLIKSICAAHNLPDTALKVKSSIGMLAYYRMAYCYYAVKVYKFSAKAAGRAIDRDHSSIFSGIKSYENLLATQNDKLLSVINNINQYLQTGNVQTIEIHQQMKQVKIYKLSWDELNAVNSFITDSIGQRPEGLPNNAKWIWRLTQSVMIQWSMRLQQKLVFRKPTPFTITLDLPTASAFMLFFGWEKQEVTTFLGITVFKIQNEIERQIQ